MLGNDKTQSGEFFQGQTSFRSGNEFYADSDVIEIYALVDDGAGNKQIQSVPIHADELEATDEVVEYR